MITELLIVIILITRLKKISTKLPSQKQTKTFNKIKQNLTSFKNTKNLPPPNILMINRSINCNTPLYWKFEIKKDMSIYSH